MNVLEGHHFHLMGSHLVVINDSGVAASLLERPSVICAVVHKAFGILWTIPALTLHLPLTQDAYGGRTVGVFAHLPNCSDDWRFIPGWGALFPSP